MRKQVKDNMLDEAFADFVTAMNITLQKKGRGALTSRHEILGVLEEEMHELIDVVRLNDDDAVKSELLDISVGALFGYLCVENELLDGNKHGQ